MTEQEIVKAYDEMQKQYEYAKMIADIAINAMKDANSRLKNLNEELERFTKDDGQAV